MLKLFIFASVLAFVAAASHPFGVVEGVVDCGSLGLLGPVQITDCDRVPCQANAGSTYDVSINFISSQTSADLVFEVYRQEEDFWTLLLDIPINGVIEAGIEYEFAWTAPILPEFADWGLFQARFYIVDREDRRGEICAHISLQVHN